MENNENNDKVYLGQCLRQYSEWMNYFVHQSTSEPYILRFQNISND